VSSYVFQVLIDVCGDAVKTLILLKRISSFIAMNSSKICHRKTQKTSQDNFFNKDAMRKKFQAAPCSAGV
jgi:hypothetical protein